MKRSLILCFLLVGIGLTARVPQIPNTLGWYEIPNTKMDSVCQNGPGSCAAVVSAWGGGVMDTQRNRLIVWGGGHNDYGTNEVYALTLNGTPSWSRLTTGVGSALNWPDEYAGGCGAPIQPIQPQSTHTYDTLDYLPNVDRMWHHSLSYNCTIPGWTFNFAANDSGQFAWERQFPTYTLIPGYPQKINIFPQAYDSVTGWVFMGSDNGSLYTYDYSANAIVQRLPYVGSLSYTSAGAIDPLRRKFVTIGDGEQRYWDITGGTTPYSQSLLNATGDLAAINVGYPGIDYDPIADRLVAWPNGGDSVYVLNFDTRVWTKVTGPGSGPPARSNADTGTSGRFRYVPSLGGFIVVNDVNQNAYFYRLSGGTPPVPDTQPPSAPTNLAAVAASSTQINLSWTAATDNVGVTGYRVERCSGAACSNFVQVAIPSGTSYSDTALTASTSYSYRLRAADASGNLSGYSSIAGAATPVANTGTWTFCANENQQCVFTGTKEIRYGANNIFVYRTLTDGTPCTNAVFGDPVVGVNKMCDLRDTVAPPPPPPPTTSYQVGPGKPYATIAAAVTAAPAGSTIEIDAGTYADEIISIDKSLTLKGMGGRAHMKWGTGDYRTNTTSIPNGKGILIINATTTIDGLEFSGAKVADENGAGVRYQSGDLTIRNSYFHHNQNGLLGEGGANATLVIEKSIFDSNGYCPSSCGHNLYVGNMGKLVFRFNRSVNSLDGSHTLKSRANVNEVISNFLSTKNSDGSIEADFPNGGTVYFIGNVVEQGSNTSNSSILAFAAEGATNPTQALYVVNNTFYNWRGSGTFVQVSGAPTLSILNNAFANGGTMVSGATTSLTSDKALVTADFVNASTANYHLVSGSSAIDAGVNPGSAGTYSLTSQFEYVDPANSVARVSSGALDVGAYEFGTVPPPPPPPPPTDPCVQTPLTASVQTWPATTAGSNKRFIYTTSQAIRSFAVDTNLTRVVFTSMLGCTTTVTK